MIERVRWDRKKGMWGVLVTESLGLLPNESTVCNYKEHFSFGVMINVTTHIDRTLLRGCAPHTSIVGWASGALEIRTHGTLAIGSNAVQVRFDGRDFYAGTQLVKACEKMFFFKDGRCMVEGII